MIKRAFFVLPKSSSYTYKDLEEQSYIEKQVRHWESFCRDCALPIFCFIEDFLAYTLLKSSPNVSWVESLANGDRTFLLSNDETPIGWDHEEVVSLGEHYIKAAVRRYPIERSKCDPAEFKLKRMSVLRNRLRYASSRIVNNEQMVISFRNNNEFCNIEEGKLGDGRLIVTCDIRR